MTSRTGRMAVSFTEMAKTGGETSLGGKNQKFFCSEQVKSILFIILVGSCVFKSGAQRKGHMIGHINLRLTDI